MNGIPKSTNSIDDRPDLLPHKYRPDGIATLRCNTDQAQRLRQWIQEFLSSSNGPANSSSHSDYDDSSSASDSSGTILTQRKCALVTGPPGVGKTSLVYTIANELNLHIVESHSSERRDGKLFNQLKLTNQKGKINGFAKLFQTSKPQQHTKPQRKKRRKIVAGASDSNGSSKGLSLSGDASIILFDDIDVVFEEDGPFLKSLVDFIKESKRPVVLTATQSIGAISKALVHFEHIHLGKPSEADCARLLKDVCRREKFQKIGRQTSCQMIAKHYGCDIRQCLNQIHFYGDEADNIVDSFYTDHIPPRISGLKLQHDSNKTILCCYRTSSLIDLMDSRLNILDRSTLLEHWLDGKPSSRSEEYNFNLDLGEQVRQAIVEITKKIHSNELLTHDELIQDHKQFKYKTDSVLGMCQLMNSRIKSRIEPPDAEFYTDIVPAISEIVSLELLRKTSSHTNDDTGSSRRSRRMLSYLDSISVYLEPNEIKFIHETGLKLNELCGDSDK